MLDKLHMVLAFPVCRKDVSKHPVTHQNHLCAAFTVNYVEFHVN